MHVKGNHRMPIGPWELAIMCCFTLPVVAVIVIAIYVIQKRRTEPLPLQHAVETDISLIICPVCSSSMAETAKFCPNCGEPRSRVRQELERRADETGRSYEDLLQEERSSRQASDSSNW